MNGLEQNYQQGTAKVADEPLLAVVYPYWLYLEPHLNGLYFKIKDKLGTITKEEYERIYDKYVSKYFTTWDNISCAINGDYEYPPVIFCWYAEKIGIKPTYPIRIMRMVADSILNNR
ncbi:MAG: hypothetical protein M0P47_09345 [Bacteroidales bacterium]|nr:hypothetical protein [Bacteroidales bacterium]